jgi:hypothetical protein
MFARIEKKMPMQDYLDHPGLSSSGMQDLLVSPLQYWANSPTNPDYERRTSEAKATGTAYHTRILEGREEFERQYATAFDASRFPDALRGGEQLRNACRINGLKVSGSIAELEARLRDVPGIRLLTDIEKEFVDVGEKKEFLPAKLMRQIEIAAQSIFGGPFGEELTGGEAELSIFWQDEATGVDMKCRLDYLKGRSIIDLKTFANQMDRPVGKAVAAAVQNYGYGLKAVTYIEGLRAAGIEPESFTFLFVQTGCVPNVVAKRWHAASPLGPNMYAEKCKLQYRRAIDTYADCLARFGSSPWAEPIEATDFFDPDFSQYYLLED